MIAHGMNILSKNDSTWHLTIKAWQRINIMRLLKFQLNRKSLQTVYFAFIRPILEYADTIWNNYSQYESNELKKIQNEAARVVTGANTFSIHSVAAYWNRMGNAVWKKK